MNFIIDKEKAIKSWVLPSERKMVQPTNDDKKKWMEEYAEMHKFHCEIDPYGEEDWGDEKPFYEQNLLPVVMKIAYRNIGLDLVSVKPLSSPRIDLGFIDFKYKDEYKEEKEYKRVYSEIDPYGEEDWDN